VLETITQHLDLHAAGPLLALSVIIVVGISFGWIARRLHLPGVTGQILAGVLIGPSVLDLFAADAIHGLAPLTHFALGLIAFTVGSHLNIPRLRNAGRRLFILIIAEATIIPALVFISLWTFGGLRSPTALLFATAAIDTAPATIVAIVSEMRARGTFVKTLIAAVALNNMTCIFLFEVTRSFAGVALSPDPFTTADLMQPAFKVAVAVGIGAMLGIAFELLARRTVRDERLATASIVALLLASGAASYFHASPLLACLIMGLVQTNLTSAREKMVDTVFEDFEPVILAVFFTLAGMHLSLQHAATAGLLAALLFAGRFLGKLLAADLAMRLAGATDRVRKNLGLALIPQAGVAVGLVILVQEDLRLVDVADLFTAVVLTVVTVNEIIGPILTRNALARAGEVGMDRSRLIDFLHEEHIVTNLEAKTKRQAIEQLVHVLITSHELDHVKPEDFLQSVLDREAEVSTCLGDGLAIPHGEIANVDQMVGVMGLSRAGLPFETPDGRPIHCMILLATPPDQRQRHLEVLAALAKHIGTDPKMQNRLFNATSAAHAYDILHGEEAMHFNYFLTES